MLAITSWHSSRSVRSRSVWNRSRPVPCEKLWFSSPCPARWRAVASSGCRSTRCPTQKNVAGAPSFERISAIRGVYSGWGPSSKVSATAARSPGPRHSTGPNSVARGWKSPQASRPSAPVVTAASGIMLQDRDRLTTPQREPMENAGRLARSGQEMPRREDEADQARRGMKANARRTWLVLQDARLWTKDGPFRPLDASGGCSDRDEDVAPLPGDGLGEPRSQPCRRGVAADRGRMREELTALHPQSSGTSSEQDRGRSFRRAKDFPERLVPRLEERGLFVGGHDQHVLDAIEKRQSHPECCLA